jgi:GR25 family glycosyltransferase involved in LPS biosynthesis
MMTYLKVASEVFLLLLKWWRKSLAVLVSRTKSKDIQLDDLHFVYINLDHRMDRRVEMENQFAQLKISNFKRLPATRNKLGALGCSFSHLDALKVATKMKGFTVICEDDAEFIISRNVLNELIRDFYNDSRLDVLCLGYNSFNKVKVNSNFFITSNSQTMVCYLPKEHILNELVKIAEVSINGLASGGDQEVYAIDQVWKQLQKKFIFAIPIKRSVIQRPSYSDIEQKDVKYGI